MTGERLGGAGGEHAKREHESRGHEQRQHACRGGGLVGPGVAHVGRVRVGAGEVEGGVGAVERGASFPGAVDGRRDLAARSLGSSKLSLVVFALLPISGA